MHGPDRYGATVRRVVDWNQVTEEGQARPGCKVRRAIGRKIWRRGSKNRVKLMENLSNS